MYKNLIQCVFVIFFAQVVSAQSPDNIPGKVRFGDQNNYPNAAVNTAVAFLSSFKKSDVAKDTLSGSCSFNGGTCNGAQVSLSKDGQKIFVTTLTSMGTFKIPNLKPNMPYMLELTWPLKKLSKTKSVEAGEYVEIKLSAE